MVPIRRAETNGHSNYKLVAVAALMASLVIASIYLISLPKGGPDGDVSGTVDRMSPQTALNHGLSTTELVSAASSKNKEELDEEDVDPMKIIDGSVAYGGDKSLPYYHCGPSHIDNPELTELVLLHGAAFTKEDWKTSGILGQLCDINNEEDEGNLSISALDLPVSADGAELGKAFDALTAAKVLSGRAVTIVSPSASGKALVSLGETPTELGRIVKAWIPVASFAVLSTPESALLQYKSASVPILAIHGNQDARGKDVTKRLVDLNGAKGVELEGRHPVYLDSPEEFIQEIMQFLDEKGL